MKNKALRRISLILTFAMLFTMLQCMTLPVTASPSQPAKVFTFTAENDVFGAHKGADGYAVSFGSAVYDGATRSTADATFSSVGASHIGQWDRLDYCAAVYNQNTSANGWKKINPASFPGGYVRVWINSPKAMRIMVAFQESESPYLFFTANAVISDDMVGKLSSIDIPLSSFHQSANALYAAVTLSNPNMTTTTGKFFVTATYTGATWVAANETITFGNVEVWDGVPALTNESASYTPGERTDKFNALAGCHYPRPDGGAAFVGTTAYATNESYGTDGTTSATFGYTSSTNVNGAVIVDFRTNDSGWKSWNIGASTDYLRLWVKVTKPLSFAITAQETNASASMEYLVNLKTNQVNRFVPIDIPVAAFASIDKGSGSRFNKLFISVNSGAEYLAAGESYTLGQIEQWNGRPPYNGPAYVTTTVNDSNFGAVTGGGFYWTGDNAHLKAIPADGYHFRKWIVGGQEYTQNPLDQTIATNMSAEAVFAPNGTSMGTVQCIDGKMTMANNNPTNIDAFWDTPSYDTADEDEYTGSEGTFTVKSTADMSGSGFYDNNGYSKTAIMYTISDYGPIDFAGKAEYGMLRVWVKADKAMRLNVGVKDTLNGQYGVEAVISAEDVGKFVAIDVSFAQLVVAGWNPANKAKEIIVRRPASATATNGLYLLAGESITLGRAELWTGVNPDEIIYTLTATANTAAGGTVTGSGDYTYGAAAQLTAAANAGYSFVGFKVGTTLFTATTINVTVVENTNITAIFKATNESAVTFVNQAGGIVDVVTVKTGSMIPASKIPAVPQWYGYTVAGWADYAAGTVVYGDMTVSPAATATGGSVVIDTPAAGSEICMNSGAVVTLQANGLYSVTVFAATAFDGSADVLDIGFIMAKGDQSLNADFVIGGSVDSNKVVVETSPNNQYMLTITNIPASTLRTLRAYAAVRDGGNISYVYSDTAVQFTAN